MIRFRSTALAAAGFVALLALSGCQLEDVAADTPTCPGGDLVQAMHGPICLARAPDSGQPCRRASDCAGYCLAETRTCSPHTSALGCVEFLDDAGRTAAICID